ncbi:unnamed protein product [Adineta steineri]|uniref:G-protein coupled receptors family 1 profile domain-containing protein n=1 Tax=Adineta steineri TaxID=433720 RepID=A0A819EZH9_9BILA|nr:unnamed protein product [Adineta steineri]CAF1141347.1 unnamed protein product [Adineta steineri]CAF3859104.1 unnamed protein product [Adineta steineri]CAF3914611.1 unnamed protein product [Adineta steineri]
MVSLTTITSDFTIYSFFIILIIGTIGNICNLIAFLSKDLRTKACIFYMVCSASLDLFFSNFGIIIRFSTEYFGNNLTNTNRGICKVRGYLLVCLPAMASTGVLLATFDRCVSTSPNARWRRLSSICFAQRLFIIFMLFILISSSFHLIVYDIRNGSCAPSPGLAAIIVALYIILSFLIPNAGMIVFGIMTRRHLQQSKNRIAPISLTNNNQQLGVERTNRQLLILIFTQASVSTVLLSQRCLTYSYLVITSSIQKSVEQQQIEYFIQQVSLILMYVNYGMTFFINYCSSSMFRKTFRASIQSLMNRCFRFCKCGQMQN